MQHHHVSQLYESRGCILSRSDEDCGRGVEAWEDDAKWGRSGVNRMGSSLARAQSELRCPFSVAMTSSASFLMWSWAQLSFSPGPLFLSSLVPCSRLHLRLSLLLATVPTLGVWCHVSLSPSIMTKQARRRQLLTALQWLCYSPAGLPTAASADQPSSGCAYISGGSITGQPSSGCGHISGGSITGQPSSGCDCISGGSNTGQPSQWLRPYLWWDSSASQSLSHCAQSPLLANCASRYFVVPQWLCWSSPNPTDWWMSSPDSYYLGVLASPHASSDSYY